MLSLRKHLGTAGLLVAVVALIAALGGSAIAANGGNSGDATASAKKKNRKGGGNVNKLIKREARKFSKQFSLVFAKRFPGPIGPQGVPGLPGAPGSDGSDGSDGSNGSNGSDGAPGKSVEVKVAACGGLGGAEVKQEGAGSGIEVCNGEDGEDGEDGTFSTEPLPSGETLTGTWAFGPEPSTTNNRLVPISFPIPLASTIAAANTHFIAANGKEIVFNSVPPEELTPTNCLGTVEAPSAEPGHLCVYTGQLFEAFSAAGGGTILNLITRPGSTTAGAGTTGAVLGFNTQEAGAGNNEARGHGTWAVTAP